MTGDPGAGIGGRLAGVLADAHVAVRARLAPIEAAVRHQATEAAMERWERNLAEFNRRYVGSFLADPDIPDDVKEQLRALVEPTHQTDFLIGVMTSFVAIFAIAGAIQSGNVDKWRAWGYRHVQERRPSIEQLAGMVVEGVIADDEGQHWAQDWGLTPSWFDRVVRLTGNPPGPQELLLAWRRGFIDEARLEHGIRQSAIKNEWIDVVKSLRYQPPGAAAAINGAVQGFLTDAQARRKAEEAGLDPDDFPWMLEVAGNPPGNETMLELLNRGDMSEAQVRAGLRESNLKNKYIDALLKSRRRLMQQEQIRMSINHGTMTDDDALHRFQQLGFDAADSASFVALAHSMKTQQNKDLARAQVVTGYEERFFDRAKATAMLMGLGYDTVEAAFLLDLADHDREVKFTNAAIGRFHNLYVRRRLQRMPTSNALDRLGVPPDQRDDLLKLWDLERDADTPDLSVAQWQGLLRRGIVDPPRFATEMTNRGYTDEEAQFLMPLAFPPSQFGGG